MCCAVAAAGGRGGNHNQGKDQPGKDRNEPAAPAEIAPWDKRLSKDAGKGKYADVKWSCIRTCNEIKGDESWLMTLEFPSQEWSDEAPYGVSRKTGLPLERAEFRRDEEEKHLSLYRWLARRGDRVSSRHLTRAAVVIKWQNGMELEISGTQKDGFDRQDCVWREPEALAAMRISTVSKPVQCADCEEKERQIEKLSARIKRLGGDRDQR